MVEQVMPQKKIALPNAMRLYELKRQTGFESQSIYRENGAPTWHDDLPFRFREGAPHVPWLGAES